MADSATAERGGTPGRGSDPLDELRLLLVGPESAAVRTLRKRVEDLDARTQDVGEVLPGALGLRSHDPKLAAALGPSVEGAITTSVRRNPGPLADALFPVMGPAIRKAVAHQISSMLEAMNQALEYSLSWHAVQWRWIAFRTGKSFSEVVLLHTLVYRVEQVFLIERAGGLLLQHVAAPGTSADAADVVSGMLTAIRDFVRDSFKVGEHEGLEALHVGPLAVWIEQGPHAVIAAVVRGTAPRGLRDQLQNALDTIHVQHARALESFNGDTAAFEATRPVLEGCLQAQFRHDTPNTSRTAVVLGAIALAAVLVWTFFAVRDRVRWNQYLSALRAEPGIVVVDAGRRWGRPFVDGLRDPLARDPVALLEPAGLAADNVTSRWEPYQTLEPPIVLARARTLLQPPASVTLRGADGVLLAEGTAPTSWIERSRELAPFVPGVTALDTSKLRPADVDTLVERIAATGVLFVTGRAEILADQESSVQALAEDIRRLDRLAGETGRRFRLEIVGHADADGAEAANVALSLARAERFRDRIVDPPLDALVTVVRGAGSREPASRGTTDAEKQQNRRVTVVVSALTADEGAEALRR